MKTDKMIQILVILLYNLIPIVGILLLEWRVFNIVFLYWFEFLILGIFILLKSPLSYFKSIKSGFYRFALLLLVSNFFYFSFIVIFLAPHYLNNTSHFPTFILGLKQAFLSVFNETLFAAINIFAGNLYLLLSDKKYFEKSGHNFNGKLIVLHITILFIGAIATRFQNSQFIILIFLILFKTWIDITTNYKSTEPQN